MVDFTDDIFVDAFSTYADIADAYRNFERNCWFNSYVVHVADDEAKEYMNQAEHSYEKVLELINYFFDHCPPSLVYALEHKEEVFSQALEDIPDEAQGWFVEERSHAKGRLDQIIKRFSSE